MFDCETCGKDASLKCSACQFTRYCSAECQQVDWKAHKKLCKMHQICNEINAAHDARPPPIPKTDCCTGCGLKFDDDDEDDEEAQGNICDDECPECGYLVCESCAVDTSSGTCYCADHNFGQSYCLMEPRWWHRSSHTGKSYVGDRHPISSPGEYPDDMYEPEERACQNCGEVTKVWKKEFCK